MGLSRLRPACLSSGYVLGALKVWKLPRLESPEMNFRGNENEIISAPDWIAKQTTHSGVLFHLRF